MLIAHSTYVCTVSATEGGFLFCGEWEKLKNAEPLLSSESAIPLPYTVHAPPHHRLIPIHRSPHQGSRVGCLSKIIFTALSTIVVHLL